MRKTELAYLAGIVDGEGSISVKSESKKRPYVVYLSVTNTNYDMIKIFETLFGGKVRKRNWSAHQKSKNAANWKPCYEWCISKRQAATAVSKLLPYIRIKSKQAVLLLRLHRIRKKYNGVYLRHHPEIKSRIIAIFERIKQRCKKLNKRGVNEELLVRPKEERI